MSFINLSISCIISFPATTVDGYTPIGIVGARSNHGSVLISSYYLNGTTIYLVLKNTQTYSISVTPAAIVLYHKS